MVYTIPVDSRTSRREPDAVVWIDNDHFATANRRRLQIERISGNPQKEVVLVGGQSGIKMVQ